MRRLDAIRIKAEEVSGRGCGRGRGCAVRSRGEVVCSPRTGRGVASPFGGAAAKAIAQRIGRCIGRRVARGRGR